MSGLAARLYRLQQMDRQLDALRARRDALRWDLEDDTPVAQAQTRWQEALQAWQTAEADLRRLEETIQALRAKLRREETRLYSGEVTHPKELQGLQMEVQSLRQRLDRLEDQALAQLQAVEEAEAARDAAQQALDKARAAWQARRERDARTLAQVEAEQAQLAEQRRALWDSLPAEAQALYAELRNRRRGVAVAGVREGVCLACGATLSTAVLQQARAAHTLVRCPTCGRILYVLD